MVLGTTPLVNGQATFTATFPWAGTYSIVATYSGDDNYRPGNSNVVTQIVRKHATSTNLSSDPNPSAYGHLVKFTATVSSAGPLPGGLVIFMNGNAWLGSAELINGVATLVKINLPRGSQSITAIYDGDVESAESVSPVMVQTVN
jgi:hypothetical protein